MTYRTPRNARYPDRVWLYFDLINGWIYLNGKLAFENQPHRFKDGAEAEEWLQKLDYRGSVR